VASNQLSELAAERHLEAVTRGASSILGMLSSDRYTLVRTPEGAFAVADAAHGGLVRAPSTLSGGETFLVSLALALSLSERIQLAGRTRFDFFFLDEGFGSLDAGTLDTALGALEQLRGSNRVIGMISHVPAIEERMPRRLRVSTERRGGATTVTHEP
jgi:DNA repair protein SbcC/Rad50